MFLCNDRTSFVTDSGFDDVEPKPRGVAVLLPELIMYGFGVRGPHNWFEKTDMKKHLQTWQVIVPGYEQVHAYI